MSENLSAPSDPADETAHHGGPSSDSIERRLVRTEGEAELRPPAAGPKRRRAKPPPVAPPRQTPFDRLASPDGAAEGTGQGRGWTVVGKRKTSSFLASAVFHAALLVGLGLAFQTARSLGTFRGLTIDPNPPVPLETADLADHHRLSQRDRLEGETVIMPQVQDVPDVVDLPLGPAGSDLGPRYPLGVDPAQLWQHTDAGTGGGLDGRNPQARAALVRDRGGTPRSEAAVERGLRWLMAQQHEDGSWSFDHRGGSPGTQYRNPGTEPSTTAATGLALLPFLGAGYTHVGGEYQDVVARGLYYLNNRALMTPQGADLREGTMYAQGIGTLAVCEAHVMTGDPGLKGLAQRAIDFIVYAQDKKGGGWRYTPGEPGDTTVTGWQLMSLRSGRAAGLNVPSTTLFSAQRFLDGVAVDQGARYGYMTPTPKPSTTSIGLLCRMYTGWGRENPALRRGIDYLDQWRPSKSDLYYDYYATQVMNHFGGPKWNRWNTAMRDYLVETQDTEGLENGSWYFPDPSGDKGGRLYNTAMAVMILEVYYRYMPLYRQDPP